MADKYNFFDWYNSNPAGKDQRLFELVSEFSEEYFADFRFERGTVTEKYALVTCDDTRVYEDAPCPLNCFDDVLERYQYHVADLDGGVAGCVNFTDKSVTISPCIFDDETERDAAILHEVIHIYERELLSIPCYARESILLALYNDLKEKIPKLDKMILAHSHLYRGMRIYNDGGEHGVLFLLKSLDIDLRKGWALGTACGYGRAEMF